MKVRDLNASEIRAFVEGPGRSLEGARLKKVQDTLAGGLMFYMSRGDLYVHVEAGLTHLALGRRIPAPKTPSAFVMLLRKHLRSAVLKEISMPRAWDRVVFLAWSSGHTVVLELTGRHGNVLLLSGDDTILGSWHPSSSTTRPLHAGAEYTLPPEHEPFTQEPVLAGDGVFEAFQRAIQLRRAEERTREARRDLKRKLKRVERAISAVEQERAGFERDLVWRRMGDLFLTVAHQWPEGVRSMRLDPAPDGGEPVTLELPDRIHDPIQASQNAYARYRKARRGLEATRKRLDELVARKDALQHELEGITVDSFLEERITALPAPSKTASRKPKERKKGRRDVPGRVFVSADGLQIYVGRNSRENHELTFRHAHGSHHWFHARDYPGSHVVVFATGQLPRETLLDAATLAIHYSDARTEGEVIHALRKDLSPVKGAQGQVRVARSKIVYVVVDPSRLARLRGDG